MRSLDGRHKWRWRNETVRAVYYDCRVCGRRDDVVKMDWLTKTTFNQYRQKLLDNIMAPSPFFNFLQLRNGRKKPRTPSRSPSQL